VALTDFRDDKKKNFAIVLVLSNKFRTSLVEEDNIVNLTVLTSSCRRVTGIAEKVTFQTRETRFRSGFGFEKWNR
jgi:hypothetical protein